MPLPYPQNLTPDSPPYSTVQINEYWWSVIFGFGDSALNRESWDVTDEEWNDEVLPAVINALDTGMNCDCIKDLTFDPITGKLTYVDGDDNTVTVFDSSDTFTSNNYYVITSAETGADNAYCYAAHLLAEKASDDLQDMLEVVDVLEDATLSVFSEVFASLIDLVPLFGDLAESAIRITDNMAEAAFDWVKENARDIEARALTKEIFYCAIKTAMENGGQGSIRQEIIQEAGANLIEFAFSYIDDVWEIPDLWDVFEDAYVALDGELLAYGIVAWFLITDIALDTLGADRPLEAIMAHATKHAAAHDNRDCASFACNQWEETIDLTADGTTFEPHFAESVDWAAWTNGVGFEDITFVRVDPVQQVRVLYIRKLFDAPSWITSVKLTVSIGDGSYDVQYREWDGVGFTTIETEENVTGDNQVLEYSDAAEREGIALTIFFGVDNTVPYSIPGTGTMTELVVSGTGHNPFE